MEGWETTPKIKILEVLVSLVPSVGVASALGRQNYCTVFISANEYHFYPVNMGWGLTRQMLSFIPQTAVLTNIPDQWETTLSAWRAKALSGLGRSKDLKWMLGEWKENTSSKGLERGSPKRSKDRIQVLNKFSFILSLLHWKPSFGQTIVKWFRPTY